MILLTVVSLLAVAIGSRGVLADEEMSDKEMFLNIIKCAQKAIITGLPEADIPTHDPLTITRNFTLDVNIGTYKLELALENMYMEGIPYWEVQQMDELTVKVGNPIFNYTIYWKVIAFEGTWRASLIESNTKRDLLNKKGDFGFEFDHITFSGIFDFSKPEDDKKIGFNDLTLHLHTKESKLHVDELGLLSDIIEATGGTLLTYLLNTDLLADQLGAGIRDRFNDKWIAQPERVEAIISNCKN